MNWENELAKARLLLSDSESRGRPGQIMLLTLGLFAAVSTVLIFCFSMSGS